MARPFLDSTSCTIIESDDRIMHKLMWEHVALMIFVLMFLSVVVEYIIEKYDIQSCINFGKRK